MFDALYFAHADLSKTRDATGICVGHVVGTKKVSRLDARTLQDVREELPIIRIDLVLRVVPPEHGEIDIPRVRSICHQLRNQGVEFGLITFDAFGSQESIKTLKDAGFRADLFSVDRDPSAYEMAKSAIYDERVLCYYVPKLEEELGSLEWQGDKVDHPSTAGASKDLADAFAAVVHHCEEGWRRGQGELEPPREPAYVAETMALYAGMTYTHSSMAARVREKVIEGKPISEQEETAIVFDGYL